MALDKFDLKALYKCIHFEAKHSRSALDTDLEHLNEDTISQFRQQLHRRHGVELVGSTAGSLANPSVEVRTPLIMKEFGKNDTNVLNLSYKEKMTKLSSVTVTLVKTLRCTSATKTWRICS